MLGKSTLAKKISKFYNSPILHSGKLYRAVANEIINKRTFSLIDRKDFTLSKMIEEKFNEQNLPYLDKIDYICPNFEKYSCYGVTDKFEKIYFDGSHTTLEGAKFFSEIIFRIGWLDKIFTKN